MKLKIKKLSRSERDGNKAARINSRLRKLSSDRRREELKQEKIAKPRTSGTKVTLNVRGNMRGVHNRLNPPDSEHMKKVRAMRRFYNKQMPVLNCNTCAFASTCPQFKAGYECQFLPFLNAHKVENETDLVNYMKELVGANLRRAHLATLMETLSGGAPTLETSEALNLCFTQLTKLHEISTGSDVGVSVETDDESLIGKIFGGVESLLEDTRQAYAEPIEVTPIESERKQIDQSTLLEDPLLRDVNEDLLKDHTREELEKISGMRLGEGGGEISVSELKK